MYHCPLLTHLSLSRLRRGASSTPLVVLAAAMTAGRSRTEPMRRTRPAHDENASKEAREGMSVRPLEGPEGVRSAHGRAYARARRPGGPRDRGGAHRG